MIAVPLFGDQEHNVAVAVKRGVAVKVGKNEITTETLTYALKEVLDNKKYVTILFIKCSKNPSSDTQKMQNESRL